MAFPLLVRKMVPAEVPMVLSNWKHTLNVKRRDFYGPHHALIERDFWHLANYVIEKITLPSAEVFIGCHESEPDTPCCWIAVRSIGEDACEVLESYARQIVSKDPELAANLERELRSRLPYKRVETRNLNLFLELKR